jgi:type IV pilus assembly protein PilM
MGIFGSDDTTGVDIGAGSVKVVRISGNGKRPRLVSAALLELPADPVSAADIKAGLLRLRSSKKIGRKKIITLIAGKDLTIRSLTLPKMPLNELREAVYWEAKRHISYPLEAAQVEFLVVGEKKEGAADKYDILLVSSEREKVNRHLDPFVRAGIDVSAVDANALALRNVLRLRNAAPEENILVVDIGAGKTEINIFRDGTLRFSRCVESGGLDMTRAVAESLDIGLPEAEELKRSLDVSDPGDDRAVAAVRLRIDTLLLEIRRSVEYFKSAFREKDVESALLTGGAALMPGIGEYCAHALEHAVEIDRPFDGLKCKKKQLAEFAPLGPRFSAAVGLALRKGKI